jgi:type VI secretion system secreted protein Hcp
MAQADMFLKVDGIAGETEDKKHKDEIEVLSFTWGAMNHATLGAGGGGGAGKVSVSDFNFVKRVDKSSPNLFLKCAKGEHIKNAILTCRKAGGEQEEYLVVTFEDVFISSYQTSGTGSEGDDVVADNVSLSYKKVKIDYKPQKADGKLGPSVITGYDVKTGEKIG